MVVWCMHLVTFDCGVLTVPNSDALEVVGEPFETHVVTCDSGYNSSEGVSFTATCLNLPGWSVLDCDGTTITEPELTVFVFCSLSGSVHI